MSKGRIETFLEALVNGTTTDIKPKSRVEAYLKALLEKGGTGGGGGVSSWNDLTDKPFYEEITELLNVENAQFTDPDIGMYAYMLDAPLDLINGETYTVTWNGVSYECVALVVVEDGTTITMLGNVSVVGGNVPPSEEPFVYMGMGSDGNMFIDLMTSTDTQNSFSIVGTTIKTLDLKFVPKLNPQIGVHLEANTVGVLDSNLLNYSFDELTNTNITFKNYGGGAIAEIPYESFVIKPSYVGRANESATIYELVCTYNTLNCKIIVDTVNQTVTAEYITA